MSLVVSDSVYSMVRILLFAIAIGMVFFVRTQQTSVDFTDYNLRAHSYTENVINNINPILLKQSLDTSFGSQRTPTFWGLRLRMHTLSNSYDKTIYYNKATFEDYFPLTSVSSSGYSSVWIRRVVSNTQLQNDQIAEPLILEFDYVFKK